MASYYYSGQGNVYVAERDTNGAAKGFVALGNVPTLEISVEVTKYEHKESMSGNRAVDLSIVQEKKGTFTMTMEDMNPTNLALVFWGSKTTVAGGNAVAESITAYLEKSTPVSRPEISAVTVKDDSDTVSYQFGNAIDAAGSKNGWYNADTGMFFIFSDAEQTSRAAVANIANAEVLHVSYTYAANSTIYGFTESSMERWLRFEGLNTIDGKTVAIDMFKCQLDPLKGYGLINEELASIEVTGSVLYDDKQAGTSKFFRQINVS